MTDFFISFTANDKRWADWIAWQLDSEGYSLIYQPWHFVPGSNFVIEINKATTQAEQTIAVLSPAYLTSLFAMHEWAAAFARDPTGEDRRLIPVRVLPCDLEGTLLAQIVYIDLVGAKESTAKQILLDGLKRKQPFERPEFPNVRDWSPPFPGTHADPVNRMKPQEADDIVSTLPPPGIRIPLSPPFAPPTLRGLKLHPNDPLMIDFVLGAGDCNLTLPQVREVGERLVKYFLTSLTIPEEHLWVNLSPFERGRIIPKDFGTTEMGQDLLCQDYVLKQVTSSALYPETELGKEFWEALGIETSDTSVDTFNKIWIIPKAADVVEQGHFAILASCSLKVLLEADYASLAAHASDGRIQTAALPEEASERRYNAVASQIMKRLVLPKIESDVNTGGNFSVLRQIFHSLVLAVWYKEAVRSSILASQFVDKRKIPPPSAEARIAVDEIYEQYMQTFRRGVYNYIKEEYDPVNQEIIPKRHFSGGFTAGYIRDVSDRIEDDPTETIKRITARNERLYWIRVVLLDVDGHGEGLADAFVDTVGGVDLASDKGFELRVDRSGSAIQLQLNQELQERLRARDFNGFRPRVVGCAPLEVPLPAPPINSPPRRGSQRDCGLGIWGRFCLAARRLFRLA